MKKMYFNTITFSILIIFSLVLFSGCHIFNSNKSETNGYDLSVSAQLNSQECNRGGQVYINGENRFIYGNTYNDIFPYRYNRNFQENEFIELLAEPADKCEFVGWYSVSNGTLSQLLSQELLYTFNISQNITIHASFTTTNSNIIDNWYNLTGKVYTDDKYSALGGNLIMAGFTPFPGQSVATLTDTNRYGGEAMLMIDLNDGYQFLGWYKNLDDEEPVSTELFYSQVMYSPYNYVYAKIVSINN